MTTQRQFDIDVVEAQELVAEIMAEVLAEYYGQRKPKNGAEEGRATGAQESAAAANGAETAGSGHYAPA